jgi:hypothetical protein
VAETSRHRNPNGTIDVVPRRFDPSHVAAGYADQVWGPCPRPTSDLIGDHPGVTVRFLANGPTGPEFELEWENGSKVTVLCEDVARQYVNHGRGAQ